LGRHDQGLAWSNKGLEVLDRANHRYSSARGLYWNAVFHQFRGEWQIVQERAGRAIQSAREYGFEMVVGAGQIMQGAARAALGEPDEGIRQMREGLAAYQATGARFQRTYHLTLLADALSVEGRTKEGLAALEEAAELVEQTGERFVEAEIHRVRGQLLRSGSKTARTKAAACFRKAIGIARRQRLKSLELRAACDLASLMAERGERRRAFDLLAPLSASFTDGLDTADLLKAKSLVGHLESMSRAKNAAE
jgi:predicted ATPase